MTRNQVTLGSALDSYANWPTPATIISDGAYGVRGFVGDTKNAAELPDWYRPHVTAWSAAASTLTSLWFWNTEVGWATCHPLLLEHGWQYVQLVVWDKTMAHAAGNVNGNTIRRFPVVTEVAALYVREPKVALRDNTNLTLQDWMRAEWRRTGMPFHVANTACGVANAATRKWLTGDHLWYMPPYEMYERLRTYANEHGDPAGVPYFEQDGAELSRSKYTKLRSIWNHQHGMTNVWSRPALRNSERVRGVGGKILHTNQKPLDLMERQIKATTNPGDVIWEPFGGLCSASVAAQQLGRDSYAAELDTNFYTLAKQRLTIPT